MTIPAILYTLADYRLNNNQSNKTTKQNPFLNLCSLTNFRVSKIIVVLYKYRYNVPLKHYLLASLSLSKNIYLLYIIVI